MTCCEEGVTKTQSPIELYDILPDLQGVAVYLQFSVLYVFVRRRVTPCSWRVAFGCVKMKKENFKSGNILVVSHTYYHPAHF